MGLCVCVRSNMIMLAMLSLTSPRSQLIRHSAHDGRPQVEMRKGRRLSAGLICFLSLALYYLSSSSSPAERKRREYISDRLPSFFFFFFFFILRRNCCPFPTSCSTFIRWFPSLFFFSLGLEVKWLVRLAVFLLLLLFLWFDLFCFLFEMFWKLLHLLPEFLRLAGWSDGRSFSFGMAWLRPLLPFFSSRERRKK